MTTYCLPSGDPFILRALPPLGYYKQLKTQGVGLVVPILGQVTGAGCVKELKEVGLDYLWIPWDGKGPPPPHLDSWCQDWLDAVSDYTLLTGQDMRPSPPTTGICIHGSTDCRQAEQFGYALLNWWGFTPQEAIDMVTEASPQRGKFVTKEVRDWVARLLEV